MIFLSNLNGREKNLDLCEHSKNAHISSKLPFCSEHYLMFIHLFNTQYITYRIHDLLIFDWNKTSNTSHPAHRLCPRTNSFSVPLFIPHGGLVTDWRVGWPMIEKSSLILFVLELMGTHQISLYTDYYYVMITQQITHFPVKWVRTMAICLSYFCVVLREWLCPRVVYNA